MSFNNPYYQSKIKTGTEVEKEGIFSQEINTLFPGAELFAFTSFTFTPGTSTGVSGPTQANLLAAYDTATYPWLNNSNFFTQGEYQGFQKFTIPKSATYRFTVRGAGGGRKMNTNYRSGTWEPYGAEIVAEFSFEKGDKIQLLVGQRGEDDNTYYATQNSNTEGDNSAPGGGGGSFVFLDKDETYPLIAAGGGAGGSRNTYLSANANTGTSGYTTQSTTSSSFGQNGNGSPGFTGGGSYWSASGAGWLTNGTGGNKVLLIIMLLDQVAAKEVELLEMVDRAEKKVLMAQTLEVTVDLAEVEVAIQTMPEPPAEVGIQVERAVIAHQTTRLVVEVDHILIRPDKL